MAVPVLEGNHLLTLAEVPLGGREGPIEVVRMNEFEERPAQTSSWAE